MTAPHLFADDAAIRHVGEGMIGRTLPKGEWTHEAHLGACLYIVAERPDIDAERGLPGLIRAYNVSVGGVNDDHNGYHETITQCFIAAVRAHLAERPAGEALVTAVNALLLSARGQRHYPLTLYSRERLFSVAARRGYVAPDL
ncbi:hypothetical protein [Sphingomonas sanxanigenens]|uniref:Uncharacterized protein n=1 Tax=Sphingomonas sanxanigenens DSM 19645 = NX02 TaxID=1123269 RepID=W0A8C7_9SPHN|nr:hypothetical protein [Sphingomonas sanxanigenens]AHE54179.1 hypothetical protein NX02_12390 [Sphingomonas sanxanigenens DSM 19645 = NX02]